MPFHDSSTFYFLGGILYQSKTWVMVVVLRCPSFVFLFQLSTISFHPQTASDYGYHAFGELARFIYCPSAEDKTRKFFASC